MDRSTLCTGPFCQCKRRQSISSSFLGLWNSWIDIVKNHEESELSGFQHSCTSAPRKRFQQGKLKDQNRGIVARSWGRAEPIKARRPVCSQSDRESKSDQREICWLGRQLNSIAERPSTLYSTRCRASLTGHLPKRKSSCAGLRHPSSSERLEPFLLYVSASYVLDCPRPNTRRPGH